MIPVILLAAVAVFSVLAVLIRPSARAALIGAGVVLALEVVAGLLLAPTHATDCGRCNLGQELLTASFFAILPAALAVLLASALVSTLARRRSSTPRRSDEA